MSTNTKTIKATCLCGACAYDLTLPITAFPLWSMWCHCNSCRHKTGTLCLSIVNPPHGWMPPKELLNSMTAYQFSERLKMYFCSTCGCSMMTDVGWSALSEGKGQHWDIHTGTLEKVDGVVELLGYEYLADTIDGGFGDFLHSLHGKELERWPHRPNVGEQIPLYWQSPDRPTIEPKPEDKLYCHCKCKGVEFYLSRPSERSKTAQSPVADLLVPYHSTDAKTRQEASQSQWWLRDNGRKFLAGNCACNSCRLDTGSEFMSWCFIPTIDISLDAEGRVPYEVPFGTLKAYQSSGDVTRYHCGKCGASVFFTTTNRTGLVDVAMGILDAPEGARAESWLDWRVSRCSFREDAEGRADELVHALEQGQLAWAEREKK